MRWLFAAMAFLSMTWSAQAENSWDQLPSTPIIKAMQEGYAQAGDVKLFYRASGTGSPVILLHGGPANSNYLANQFNALAKDHFVVAIDTRGHGKSSLGHAALSYDIMADDVVAVMDHLKIAKASVVGWSDGGITALDLGMRHADRINKIFAFGANTNTDGTEPHPDARPAFKAFIDRAAKEYSGVPGEEGRTFATLNDALGAMYASQPNWTKSDLEKIKAPVLIADGDHDEAIKLGHTIEISHDIPGAKLLIIPGASHFAFLQDPALFNDAMLDFLDM